MVVCKNATNLSWFVPLLQPVVKIWAGYWWSLSASVTPSYQARKKEPLPLGTKIWYYVGVKKKHQKLLGLIFSRPVSGNIKWSDIESLFQALGANISEREGSRIGVKLFGEVQVFLRPHPSPDTDKGAVSSVRKWLEKNGVTP